MVCKRKAIDTIPVNASREPSTIFGLKNAQLIAWAISYLV
jgi:hypothetical protein